MLPLQKWIFQEFQVEMCTLFKKSYSIHGIQEGICSLSKRIIPRNSRRDILTIQKKINPGNSKWDTLPLHKGLFREFQEGICSPSKRIIPKGYASSPKRTISGEKRDVLHLQKGLFPCSPRPRCKHVMRVKKSYLAGPRPLFQLIPVSWEPA